MIGHPFSHPAVRASIGPADLAGLPQARGLIYLATPYTLRAAPDGVMSWPAGAEAAQDAAFAVARLALAGVTAASPIVLAHAACVMLRDGEGEIAAGRLALDAVFWTTWCAPLLAACAAVHVPAIPGWQRSAGVAHEVRVALDRGIPVTLEADL